MHEEYCNMGVSDLPLVPNKILERSMRGLCVEFGKITLKNCTSAVYARSAAGGGAGKLPSTVYARSAAGTTVLAPICVLRLCAVYALSMRGAQRVQRSAAGTAVSAVYAPSACSVYASNSCLEACAVYARSRCAVYASNSA